MIIRLLLGAILAVGVLAVAEGYVIMGQNQRLKTYSEQLLDAAARLLAVVPGQSAPRTDTADEQPRIWFARLRALADLRQPLLLDEDAIEEIVEDQADDELARWEDDGGTVDDTPTVEEPVTEPMQRIDVAGGLRLPTTPPDPDLADDVDRQLARFTYVKGHRR